MGRSIDNLRRTSLHFPVGPLTTLMLVVVIVLPVLILVHILILVLVVV
jgi:hypothetical protein